ncbi:MAG: hypothetical protein NWE95_02855 [Candidatus Bathyarchaeota archaeon]|nr:hypothetical protein [Candidatus Bathyarchaeota archaeon]
MKNAKFLFKRLTLIALPLIAVCLLTLAGTVNAVQAGYTHTCYSQTNAVTVDGAWTSPTEWVDAQSTSFGTNAAFRTKYEFQMEGSSFLIYLAILVESTDATNDAGDYLQICFDGSTEMIYDGGTAPQTNDWKLEIMGHGTPTWYKGTGTGWVAATAPSTVQINSTLASSPTIATNHYIYEIRFEKQAVGVPAQFAMRVAVNDARAGGSGLQAWPPTSPDVPNQWGDVPYSTDPIPESLNMAVLIAVSSVAVIAGSVLLRKRSVANLASKRTIGL